MTDLSDDEIIHAATVALTSPTEFGDRNFAYFGDLPLFESWGLTFSQTRDSGTIERSNYRRIIADLREHAAQNEGLLLDADPPEYVQEFRVTHWACGWMDRIAVRVLIDAEHGVVRDNITSTFILAAEIAGFLHAEGPIYDEFDHSELENQEDSEAFAEVWIDML